MSADTGAQEVHRYAGLDEFEQAVGTQLGYSTWHTVTQAQIDAFADATGDHQWIHVDPTRAAAGPFGSTVAHGYLTLSLVPMLVWQIYAVDGLAMAVNYGVEKVRFPSPLTVGSRIRAGAELVSLSRRATGAQALVRVTIERDGADKPVCVADTIALLVP